MISLKDNSLPPFDNGGLALVPGIHIGASIAEALTFNANSILDYELNSTASANSSTRPPIWSLPAAI